MRLEQSVTALVSLGTLQRLTFGIFLLNTSHKGKTYIIFRSLVLKSLKSFEVLLRMCACVEGNFVEPTLSFYFYMGPEIKLKLPLSTELFCQRFPHHHFFSLVCVLKN